MGKVLMKIVFNDDIARDLKKCVGNLSGHCVLFMK